MFASIVVGTNWPDTAELAVGRAVNLAQLTGERLHADVVREQTLARLGAREVDVTQHTPSGAAADSIVVLAVVNTT